MNNVDYVVISVHQVLTRCFLHLVLVHPDPGLNLPVCYLCELDIKMHLGHDDISASPLELHNIMNSKDFYLIQSCMSL